MKSILFILMATFGLLSNSSTEPHGSLQGTVTDASDGSPILFGFISLTQNGKVIAGSETDFDGKYRIPKIKAGTYDVEMSYVGYQPSKISDVVIQSGAITTVDIKLKAGVIVDEVVITGYKVPLIEFDNTSSGNTITAEEIRNLPTKNLNGISAVQAGQHTPGSVTVRGSRSNATVYYMDGVRVNPHQPYPGQAHHQAAPSDMAGEGYNHFVENRFQSPLDEALSTFSIDVDRASYANVRRYLMSGNLPPADAVRIEEMINYFDYDYPGPKGNDPFATHHTLMDCPWQPEHQLLHIGLQGERVEADNLPAANLVFLIDVSGSMQSYNKLPLVKSSLKMLVNNLRPIDRVAIVTYAGHAGVALTSTPASEKAKIKQVIDGLGAGGSTAGAEGIHTAYQIARQHYLPEGNNRVILATDGDFNVGVSSDTGLEDLITKERKSGVFLSVLGYGMGNYQDGKMQTLANKGNGNHAYIDNIKEARKILVKEFSGTLFTIAKDVKIQIEFNPAYVQAYRLVGYENRLLAAEDFNDDTKDAGELGAGHTVTAIYEIVPVGVENGYLGKVDELKYQTVDSDKPKVKLNKNGEVATVKLRYKRPDGHKSKRLSSVVGDRVQQWAGLSDRVRLSVAVAAFGQLLRDSDYVGEATYEQILTLLSDVAKNEDVQELQDLVEAASVAQENIAHSGASISVR